MKRSGEPPQEDGPHRRRSGSNRRPARPTQPVNARVGRDRHQRDPARPARPVKARAAKARAAKARPARPVKARRFGRTVRAARAAWRENRPEARSAQSRRPAKAAGRARNRRQPEAAAERRNPTRPRQGRPPRTSGPTPLRRLSSKRTNSMFGLVAVAFVCIGIRLADIQGVNSGQYLANGGSEWQQVVSLSGERGSILDRNGDELAISIPQTTICADPHEVTDPKTYAAELAPILQMPEKTLASLLTEDAGFVYLEHTVSDATAAKVTKLNLAGVYGIQEPKRFYPAGQLATPLLGTVGTDGTGLGGLEYQYNSLLMGQPGHEVEETNPNGLEIAGGVRDYKAPVAGDDLVLTLDEPLQYDAEQALAQAIVAAKAKDGIALLMNTKTGQILADAELAMPTAGNTEPPAVPVNVDVTGGKTQPVEASSASSLTTVYEPGSVNKLITISAALQTGAVKPSDVFTIPDSLVVAGTVFHDAEAHPIPQHWTVTDILANSSNLGTIQIAARLGKTNLLKYIHDYGLGSVTDLNFPGESAGLLPTYWSGTSIADVPIGQGIAVTAMQMLAAYNTVANGGVYVPPKLVEGYIDSKGKEHVFPSAPTHRVVSKTVAAEMTTMLDEVVRVGTGTAANLDPYTVAGKTGTALVPSPEGGYEAGHYVASFAGFVPSEAPQITAMVVVDNTPDYGAAASAPTFATIARDALQQFNIAPLPPEPPAPGVPLATSESATGAGEVAGTPLPGLATAPTNLAQQSGGGSAPKIPTTTSLPPVTPSSVPVRSRSSPPTT